MCFRKGGASKLQILCQFFSQTYDSQRIIKGIIIFRATLITRPTDSDILTKQIHGCRV